MMNWQNTKVSADKEKVYTNNNWINYLSGLIFKNGIYEK